jgi:hypothetical protein
MTIVAFQSMLINLYGRLKQQAVAQEGLRLSPTRVYGAIHMCFLYDVCISCICVMCEWGGSNDREVMQIDFPMGGHLEGY